MFRIRMKVGGSIFPVTTNLLKHDEAEVIEVDENNNVLRLIDSTEWGREGFFDEPKAVVEEAVVKEAPPKKKAAPKRASAKKKAVNKQPAIPDDDESLENIDVSSI